MNIKNNHSSFLARLIGGCLILLCGVVATGWLINSNKSSNVESLKESILTENQTEFLKQRKSFTEVVDYFNDHIIYLGVKDEASLKMPSKFRKWLKRRQGVELSKLKYRESYVGKIVDGKFVEEYRGKDKTVVLEDNKFTISSSPQGQGNYCRFSIGKNKFEQLNRGLAIFILDKSSQLVAEYNFDFYKFEEPRALGKNLLSSNTNLEKVRLVLSEADYLKVKNKRDEAVKTRILLVGDEDLVNAKIEMGDKTYSAKIRLKGDWVDHLKGDKWSFRVKLEGDQMIDGMKKFSLHTPAARNYAGEWLFHEVLRKEDILHLKYSFVEVMLSVGGEGERIEKNLGVYAMEEFFEKQLIERNQRRAGVIIKLDEDLVWQKRAEYFKKELPISVLPTSGWDDIENFPIIPFSQKRVMQDETLFQQFQTARALFQAYLNEEYKLSEVFDVDQMARFNAISNLLGADHGMVYHNQRFYYNPINSKLEPIGFDGNTLSNDFLFRTYKHGFKDSLYMRKYIQELYRVTQDSYVENIINWNGLSGKVKLLEREFANYEWSDKILWRNKKYIQTNIDPVKTLNVYVHSINEDFFQLSVDNFGKMPVELKRLDHMNGKVLGYPEGGVLVNPNERKTIVIKLKQDYERLFINKKKRKTAFHSKTDLSNVSLVFTVLGLEKEKFAQVLPWDSDQEGFAQSDILRDKPNVDRYDFLIKNEDEKTITCKPGNWTISRHVIIPQGYTFTILPGTELRFRGAGKIVSFSPVNFIGTSKEPIMFTSLGGSGHGIAVLNCQDTSTLRYCKFDGLSNPKAKGWSLTGAVNFYQAPVKIFNTEFTNNLSEDALNVFNSFMFMDQAYFSHTQSDAFDGDFVEGEIRNSIFENLGNDGIDVSGSKLEVNNTVISKAGDKGLSAGEGSNVDAFNISIRDSEVALASKDQSRLGVKQAILTNNKLGMTAFQKKAEFGPAHIIADSIKLRAQQEVYLIEKGSTCKFNGKMTPTVEKVKEQMYGVNYGKSSK